MADNKKRNDIKIEYPLRHAYVIYLFMFPIIPHKMLYPDWRYVGIYNYLIDHREVPYNISLMEESINRSQYLTFSTTQEKFKFPISYAKSPIKLNSIIKSIYTYLAHQNYKVLDPYAFVEFSKSERNVCVDQGIGIWLENHIKGLKNKLIRVPKQDNTFMKIVKAFNDYIEKNKENDKPSLGFIVDKKDFKRIVQDNKFSNFLQNVDVKECGKDLVLKKLNLLGDIVADCKSCEEFKIKKLINYHLLPEELLNILYACNYNTEIRNQSYVSMVTLKNSDLMLIDTNNFELVKRNGQWYNISYDFFRYTLKNVFEYLPDNLMRYLYYLSLRASMEDKEFVLQILYLEEMGLYKEIIMNSFPKNYIKGDYNKALEFMIEDEMNSNQLKKKVQNKRIHDLDVSLAIDFLTSNDVVAINDEGYFISSMSFEELKRINMHKHYVGELSNYGLVIKVSKDYKIEMHDKNGFIYSTH